MVKVRLCEGCGRLLMLDKEHHKVVRDDVETGLCTIGRSNEPIQYDAFDCDFCGCQNIVGERKRDVYQGENVLSDKDTTEESEPQDGQISSPEDDDINDIKKKIEEAGENE